jgi:hypothetical protein
MTITLHVMSGLKAVWKWMQITPIIDTDRANTHFSLGANETNYN